MPWTYFKIIAVPVPRQVASAIIKISKLSTPCSVYHGITFGIVPVLVVYTHLQPLLTGYPADLERLINVMAYRLFAENVQAPVKGIHDHGVMQVMRHRQVHRVHFYIVQQFTIICKARGYFILFRELYYTLLVKCRTSHDLNLRI